MNAATYAPQEDTLAHRVCAYFKRLPDEELSVSDISTKWSTDSKNVGVKLERCVEAGLLAKDGRVYSAGPDIGSFDISVRPAFPASDRSRKPAARFSIDLNKVKIIKDVPMAEVVKPKNIDWPAKFDELEVGHWFALPAEGRSSVSKAAQLYKSSTGKAISIRAMEDGSLCVGRVV